jgi:hypothetical protein
MPRLSTVTFCSIAALAFAAAAVAAPLATTVSLDLKGGVGSRTHKACGVTHHYTLFHPGHSIALAGVVKPAPASFRVKLKVKQCVHGTFQTIWAGSAHESTDGSYRGTYLPHRRGLFFVRAYAHIGARTIKSDKRYLQIT